MEVVQSKGEADAWAGAKQAGKPCGRCRINAQTFLGRHYGAVGYGLTTQAHKNMGQVGLAAVCWCWCCGSHF